MVKCTIFVAFSIKPCHSSKYFEPYQSWTCPCISVFYYHWYCIFVCTCNLSYCMPTNHSSVEGSLAFSLSLSSLSLLSVYNLYTYIKYIYIYIHTYIHAYHVGIMYIIHSTHRWRVMAIGISTLQASKLRQQPHGTHRASSCRHMHGRSTIPVALACVFILGWQHWMRINIPRYQEVVKSDHTKTKTIGK